MSGAETAGYNAGYALGGMLANGMLFLALGALLVLIVFIILREFWTWYWKQSEQVALLKDIARTLQLLEERGRPLPPGVSPARAVVLPPSPQVSRTARG